MALADANYKIIYFNVGFEGRFSDGGVFSSCLLSKALENNSLNIPREIPLPNRQTSVPFTVVADDAFQLKPYIMKPFSFKKLSVQERIFNYRLSRARRIVENVFGIASARFRVLRRTMELHPIKVKIIVSAICALHNFLITNSSEIYASQEIFDIDNKDGTITPGSWRNETLNYEPLQRNTEYRNASEKAKSSREEFKDYFCREGEVPWQHLYI